MRLFAPPEPGDIVYCRFPERGLPGPAPKPRPALVLTIGELNGNPHVAVAYGTSQNTDRLYSGEFLIGPADGEAYALSGRYIGYKANYYAPEVYQAMLDYCGFDGLTADVTSGRDGINHVIVAAFGRDQSDKQLRPAAVRQQFMGDADSPLPLREGQGEGLVRTSVDLVSLPFHNGSR